MAYLLENQGTEPSIGSLVILGVGDPITSANVGILDRVTDNAVHLKNSICIISNGKFNPKNQCSLSKDLISNNHEFMKVPESAIANAYYLRLRYLLNK